MKTQTGEIEIADIFQKYKVQLDKINKEQSRVIHDILACRTEKLGAHHLKCPECDYSEISYNSCRNRHCPKCQGASIQRWISQREKELLPVSYFHVVFTIPKLLAPIALQNKKEVYHLLFKAVSQTLKQAALNPKNLGARIGLIAVLHTWDQKLLHHPHLHCIVPGGGLSKDRSEWISGNKNYFLPVKILSTVFRAKFLKGLEKLFHQGQLNFFNSLTYLSDQWNFKALLKQSCQTGWVVYSKRPFAGPKQVLRYLGRYTHRIAISNYRIKSIDQGKVSFTWKDRRKKANTQKLMRLEAGQFMKRFLLHVLPGGFMKIRYFGFMGNVVREKSITLLKELLGIPLKPDTISNDKDDFINKNLPQLFEEQNYLLCPSCGMKKLIFVHPSIGPPLLKAG